MGKNSKNLLVGSLRYLTILTSVAVFTLIFSSANAAQPAYSLKFVGNFLDNNDDVIKRYRVRCRKHDEDRFIQREIESKQYCAYGQSSMCFYNRVEAANAACELSTNRVGILEARLSLRPMTQQTASAQSNGEPEAATATTAQVSAEESAAQEKLLGELFALEEQRLAIRERRLQLRKRELELKNKQQVLAN